MDTCSRSIGGPGRGRSPEPFFKRSLFSNWHSAGISVYSRPELEVAHELNAEERFQDPATLRPYTTLVEQSFADANQPHTSGTFNAEFRPHPRWRLRYNWFSDDFEISGASRTAAMLEPVSSPRTHLNLHYDRAKRRSPAISAVR